MQVAQGQDLVRDGVPVQAAIGCCIMLLLVPKIVLPSATCTGSVFLPTISANTSLAVAVGFNCSFYWWCFPWTKYRAGTFHDLTWKTETIDGVTVMLTNHTVYNWCAMVNNGRSFWLVCVTITPLPIFSCPCKIVEISYGTISNVHTWLVTVQLPHRLVSILLLVVFCTVWWWLYFCAFMYLCSICLFLSCVCGTVHSDVAVIV